MTQWALKGISQTIVAKRWDTAMPHARGLHAFETLFSSQTVQLRSHLHVSLRGSGAANIISRIYTLCVLRIGQQDRFVSILYLMEHPIEMHLYCFCCSTEVASFMPCKSNYYAEEEKARNGVGIIFSRSVLCCRTTLRVRRV